MTRTKDFFRAASCDSWIVFSFFNRLAVHQKEGRGLKREPTAFHVLVAAALKLTGAYASLLSTSGFPLSTVESPVAAL